MPANPVPQLPFIPPRLSIRDACRTVQTVQTSTGGKGTPGINPSAAK